MRMTLATVQQQLSTPEGFAKAVDAKRSLFSGGLTSLLLGIAGLVINFIQLGSATDWRLWLVFRHFFDAGALEFESSRGQFWHYIIVYAPIILIPLGIILLIMHVVTRKSAGATLFADFQSRGWVGRQRYTGLQVKNGNQNVDTVLVSHPSIADDQFDQIALQFQTYVSSLDKKALKAFTAAATKAGILTGTTAASLAPGTPAEITAAPAQGKGEFAVVIPPAPGTTGKYRVLPLKS